MHRIIATCFVEEVDLGGRLSEAKRRLCPLTHALIVQV